MIRLIGVDLPRNKKIIYALTYIYGIGLTSAKNIVKLANIDSETRTEDLTNEQTILLKNIVETNEFMLEGDLRRFNGLNIKRLNEIRFVKLKGKKIHSFLCDPNIFPSLNLIFFLV